MAILPRPADSGNRARAEFDRLTPAEKRQAIFRLADDGFSDHGIAAATHLSVEAIRQALADRAAS